MTGRLPASLARASIAFLSMEIGLESGMRCYSGGLGVLAGDFALAAADLDLPMVFLSLACRDGYVRQTIDDLGRQEEAADPWDPADWASPLPVEASVTIEGRPVRIRAWLREIEGRDGNRLPVLLLDTDVEANDPDARAITGRLYGGDHDFRLRQEAVLGLGGKAVLDLLGLKIRCYHLNEGHAALLPLALLAERGDAGAVRESAVFTTHTPIPAGHDRFAMPAVRTIIGDDLADEAARLFEGAAELDMTRLALALTGWVNGVSQKHAEVTRLMFPGHEIHAVTNGVHHVRWTHPANAALFDRTTPGWRTDAAALAGFETSAGDEDVWAAHRDAKRALIDDVRGRTGQVLDPDRPLIGFARRMTPYKRADLLFGHLVRLLKIAERRPFQVLLAGKAHPHDKGGKALIARLHEIAHSCGTHLPIIFLPGYDIELAGRLVGGCDVWLNTPEPPLEASGTSGMKAAINGVLNLSVLDGWWLEGCEHGHNGWAIGNERDAAAPGHDECLLELLEHEVLPTWYDNRTRWIAMMKHSISSLGPRFSAERAMRDYASQAYGEAVEVGG